jgi:hypothetical protein
MEALTYFVTLALFAFVILATLWVKHEMWILACIFPVFVAVIAGFIMWLYAYEEFGPGVAVGALVVPLPLAWRLGRVFSTRDLMIAIYLAWAMGMVCALVAFRFPDTV